MSGVDERDLDLNLLRVLLTVAEEGGVTRAAARLYLTQSAVSAALGRLQGAVGEALVTRQGRGITLTARGRQVVDAARPHLRGLLDAVRAGPAFDPARCERTFRLGMDDGVEFLLLGALMKRVRREAPGARLVVIPVQFRTVNDALTAHRVDLAETVADEAPPQVAREVLGTDRFVCVHDPKVSGLGAKVTRAEYTARPHVIVSYNGDLRGIVEDATAVRRRVVCSVARFSSLGELLPGTDLVATVPGHIATRLLTRHRALRTAPLPFALPSFPQEILWNHGDDDDALRWLRGCVRDARGHLDIAPKRGEA